MADYLIQMPGGYVYAYAPALATRSDMRAFSGSLDEARAHAKSLVDGGGFPADLEPVVLGQDEAEPAAGVTPPAPTSRIEEIQAAIARLDPDNLEHFTKGGIPRTTAIEMILGDDIDASERDAAWSAMQ